jgi:hypothetical protein
MKNMERREKSTCGAHLMRGKRTFHALFFPHKKNGYSFFGVH